MKQAKHWYQLLIMMFYNIKVLKHMKISN